MLKITSAIHDGLTSLLGQKWKTFPYGNSSSASYRTVRLGRQIDHLTLYFLRGHKVTQRSDRKGVSTGYTYNGRWLQLRFHFGSTVVRTTIRQLQDARVVAAAGRW